MPRREDYAVGVGGLDVTKTLDADWDPHLQAARPVKPRVAFSAPRHTAKCWSVSPFFANSQPSEVRHESS